MTSPQEEQEGGGITHDDLVVGYHALHKVYTYLAQCDSYLVAVNLYSVKTNDKDQIVLQRLAQTGRGADYALPEEVAGDRSLGTSAAGHAAKLGDRVGFYIPNNAVPSTAFALPSGTFPAQDPHLKKSYNCPLTLLAEGFISDDSKKYVLVLISRCETNEDRGYWLSSIEPSTIEVPLASIAREHLATALAYLKWALPHSRTHPSLSEIQAWNRLPVISERDKTADRESLLLTKELVSQVDREQTKYAAVLFSDIRGFTNLTTKVSQNPEAILSKFLDFLSPVGCGESSKYSVGYFEAAHKVIRFHGGQLDKFMGDGVMSIFFNSKKMDENIDPGLDSGVYQEIARKLDIASPPVLSDTVRSIQGNTRLSSASRKTLQTVRERLTDYNNSVDSLFEAVRCGIALISMFDVCWKHIWRTSISTDGSQKIIREIEQAAENVSLGVGICGGRLVAGYFGSRWQDQFTVLGDTVNRAQRMESKAGKNEHMAPGRATAPQLIVHVPVSTIFAGDLKIDKALADLFRVNLQNKMAAKIHTGTHFPLVNLKPFFLEDEESKITNEFDDYSVNVKLHSFLVTTKKGGKASAGTPTVKEPAVGFYVEPLRRKLGTRTAMNRSTK